MNGWRDGGKQEGREGWREAGREGGMGEGEDDAPNPPVPEPAVENKQADEWMEGWMDGGKQEVREGWGRGKTMRQTHRSQSQL